jgi:electron transport complex protein RnfD
VGGSLGETSAALLLVGLVYLLLRRVISARIPLSFIGTVAVLTVLFPQGNDRLLWMGSQVLSGGLLLGAIFMATDYVTSPMTKWGQLIFGIGCGVLTVAIRYFGSYPEGVSYAILIMNCCVPLLDKVGRPRRFGAVGKEADP